VKNHLGAKTVEVKK